MQNKVSKSMIKNCRIIVVFMNLLFFSWWNLQQNEPQVDISVF